MAQASLRGSDIGVLAENEVSSTMSTNNQVVVQIPDSVSDLTVGSTGIEMSLSVPEGLISSSAPGALRELLSSLKTAVHVRLSPLINYHIKIMDMYM